MSFVGKNNLTLLLKNSDVISPFNEERIKNGSYELSLGTQVFQTDSAPRAVKYLKEDEKIEIKPGQFALLLTNEYVKIPEDKIAFISIKASIKFKGLVNVSGFHVDPGFEGKLLFSVYNAGPANIVLSNGTPYFPIWFSQLDESQDYKGIHEKQTKIPDAPVESLSQGELASPNILSKRIDENYTNIKNDLKVVEKKQEGMDYILKTVLGISIVILVKFILDWTIFNTGLDKGNELKLKQITSDSIINQQLLEKKTLLIAIDSLEKAKTNLKSAKK